MLMLINFKLSSVAIALMLFIVGCNSTNSQDSNTTDNQDSAKASRLDTVKSRGKLVCGVNGQLPGFSFVEQNGDYAGMDVDFCRAIAAALFDDPNKLEFRNLNAEERFAAVQSGKVDLLSRNTTWTLSRDTSEGLEFAPITFYDGQGLLVTNASEIKKLEDLDGKSVCVLSGTTNEQNLAERMRKRGLNYSPVTFNDADLLFDAYEQGRCAAATSDRSQLVVRRAGLDKPQDHQVLEITLSKEPLAPSTANGDSQWLDVVKWVSYAMVKAEELGINSQNVDSLGNTEDPEIKRFLGVEGNLGKDLGLSNEFARRIVKHVGNYSEVYERNIGKPFGLERGLNALSSDGGLMYSPPFR